MKNRIALVIGASGISGSNLAEKLIAEGWNTYGLSRHPKNDIKDLKPIAADLLDKKGLEVALSAIKPTHVFITTWTRKDTEADNVRVNAAMIRNLVDVLSVKKSAEHIALVTGLKHYLGPFEAYAQEGFLPQTPLKENQPRLKMENFYYAQEDELFKGAARDGYTWSVHRPHTLIGKAVGNAMNMGTTLAVYASICKELGSKFVWPGSAAQWNGISDVTDAGILAEQLIWASSNKVAANQAFNIVNGDVFRWSSLWFHLAAYFGVEAVGYEEKIKPLDVQMPKYADLWKEMATKYGLIESRLDQLSSAWHTDLDLGRPIEVLTDMSKSRKLGFTAYRDTQEVFTELFDELKKSRLIP